MSDMQDWISERRKVIAEAAERIMPADAVEMGLRDLPSALTAIEKVLELHKPVQRVFSWRSGGVTAYDPCETCHGKAGVHECGCWADEDIIFTCAECRTDKGRDIDYPCATIRAVQSAIEGASNEQ